MKKMLVILTLCTGVFSSALVFGQDSSSFGRPGFYIGAGGIYAIENFRNTGILAFKDSSGFNFRLGYRLHPFLALEAEGERALGFDLKQANLDIETWVATFNAKVFPFHGKIQPFGLIGIGAMTATADSPLLTSNVTDTDIALRFGGGLDYYVTQHWVLNMEGSYVLPRGDVDDIDYISLGGGIQYRF